MKNTAHLAMQQAIELRKAKIASQTKIASPGDGVDDGVTPTHTGERARENATDAGTPSKAMVDASAKDNSEGASISNSASTQSLGAAATDGSHGSKGADNTPKKTIEPGEDASNAKVATDVAAKLRKLAGDLDKESEAKVASLSGVERFLVDAVRTASSLKTADDAAAMGAPAPAPAADPMAGGAPAGAPPADPMAGGAPDEAQMAEGAIEELLKGLQDGSISEEQAQQILDEMVQSGALKPEEVEAIKAELAAQGGGAGAAPAPAGAPAGAPPAPAPMDEGAAMVEDPGLEAKLAAVDVGPDHELYAQKLETLYPAQVAQGEHFALKVASHLGYVGKETKVAAASAPVLDEATLKAAAAELKLDETETADLIKAGPVKVASALDAAKIELITRMALKQA